MNDYIKLPINNYPLELSAALLIIKNEGYRSMPYADTTGNKTIGYGFNMADLLGTWNTMKKTIAWEILFSKISILKGKLEEKIPFFSENCNYCLSAQIVLIDMAYNLGIYGLMAFNTFLGYIKQGDIASAIDDLKNNTEWYKQVPDRANRDIANLMECLNSNPPLLIL